MERSGQMYRFGVFELDTNSHTLRKSGMRVGFQEQPFRLLTRLVARAGEVVTREELREELWPADTHVDFERGLNNAVKKAREVLSDSAASPRFIETVPRVGYRFIAPVSLPETVPVEQAAIEENKQSRRFASRFRVAAALILGIGIATLVSLSIFKRSSGHSNEPEAFELLLRGRQILQSKTDPDNTEIARHMLEQANRLDPKLVDSYGWLANSLARQFHQGRGDAAVLQSARELANQALGRGAENGPALLARIGIHHSTGEWEQSLRDLRGVMQQSPFLSPEQLQAAGIAYTRAGQLKRGAALLEHALRLNPQNGRARLALVANYRFQGTYERALEILGPVENRPQEWAAERVELLYNLGQYERAAHLAQVSANKYGAHAPFWYYWSKALKRLKRNEEADRVLRDGAIAVQASADEVENFRTLVELALLRANLNDRPATEELLARAAALSPNNPWIEFFAGMAWALLQDEERALREIDRSVQHGFLALHYLDYFSRPELVGSDRLRQNAQFQQVRGRLQSKVERLARTY